MNRRAARRLVARRRSVAAIAVFLGLGAWQVQRLYWKLDLIARVDARLAAAPVAAPGPGAWGGLTRGGRRIRPRDRHRPLRSRARGADARGDRARAGLLGGDAAGDAATSWCWSTAGSCRRTGATRQRALPGRSAGPVTVNGLLRLSEPGGGFLRGNDPLARRWYSRDVDAIAARRGLEGPVAPYFIDADATPNPGGLPVGGLTVVHFRNAAPELRADLVRAGRRARLARVAGAGARTATAARGRCGARGRGRCAGGGRGRRGRGA